MRVCVITSSFPANPADARAAAGLFVCDFASAVAELGHDVVVLTPDKDRPTKETVAGIEVEWFPWLGGAKPLSAMKPYRPADAVAMASLLRQGTRALERLAASRPIDRVMAMWAVPAGLLARRLERRQGTPFTVWCLGSDLWTYGRYPILRRVVGRVLRAASDVCADGLELARQASALGGGREVSFQPSSRRLDAERARPLELGGDGPHFLFVGRYEAVKGVDVLLEAMAHYRAAGGRGHLAMFGGGSLDRSIRERAARLDLRGAVTVGDYAEEETYVSHLKACDAALIPSRMESIPLVFSDALQMGKPVIASDVGDMGELLRATPAGLIVPPEDAGALGRALGEFERGPRDRFAAVIPELASRFDLERTAEEWIRRCAEPSRS